MAWSRCLDVENVNTKDFLVAQPLPVTPPADDSDEAIRWALQRLSQDVTHHLIAAQTGRLLMFHAGAVSHPQTGASVVFVAPSGTGKTTLSGLLGTTNGYLTDETVGVDPTTGRIHPYPKPLSIASGQPWRKIETSPHTLGLLPAHPQPTVARVVLLRRQADIEDQSPTVQHLGTLDAVAALIPESSALNRLPRPLHTVAELLDRTGPLARLTYREAGDLVPVLSDVLNEAA
ncbi:hypothetical protein [Aestuariimicrobium sp. Y1814]|uniref:hypothetical protein n=1 Tax=Aestuariimicrobium sp. Y1814 TaxID=3418742 RepID=UPI003DA6E2A4